MSRRSGGRGVYERDTYELDRHDHRGNYDHVFEEDVETRFRRRPHAPDASRVREIERVRAQGHSPPSEFVRKSYGRSSSAGPLVRMPRVRDDDYEFIEHEHERGHWDGHEHRRGDIGPVHRRSRIVERRFSPPPSHARGFEREELVLRRERSRPPPPREPRFERDEFVLRREKDHGLERRPVRAYDWEWELERERSRERERERDVETERGRERVERDRRRSSYVRERSNMRGDTEEIIVRRDERGGNTGHGKGDVKREEVIIRRRDESSSSSDSSSHPPIEPPPIRAPPIHQEVITHHRHIGHGGIGYEVVHPHPPPSEASSRHVDDEIEIRRRGPAHDNERHRDVVIMRDREGSTRGQREAANIRDEAEYYNRLSHKGGHIGEAYNGATKDWSIVDVPPGTKRVELEGVDGASQEITWQRYHGVRRAKFHVDGDEYASDRERTRDQGRIGKRYVGVKDKRDRLWTEITKDLVVKEAIERAGYDYEETQYFYYVFAYLKYDDVAHLVALSDDYRQARRERIREIQRERTRMITPPPLPAPAPPPPAAPLLLERPDYDEERIIEHEVFVDEDKVPLPMRARRW
ncbi:hypothetical protein RJ035_001720 [Blastomyces gilchristii]